MKYGKIILAAVLFLSYFQVSVQLTLKEGSFKLSANDTEILINRNTPEQRRLITDDNNQLCALIRISAENMTYDDLKLFANPRNREVDRATFVQKVETDHVNELWLFLSPGASYLILKHPDYGNCTFDFNAMGISLQSGKVYEAVLVGDRKVFDAILARNTRNASQDEDKNQYLIISATPPDASIYINGEFVGIGELSKRLPIGMRHSYRVEAPMHKTVEGTVELFERTQLPIKLTPMYGYVSVRTTPEEGAMVYIDNEQVGVTPLESEKRYASGQHSIRVVKSQYKPVEQTFTIEDGQRTPLLIDMSGVFAQVTLPEVTIYVDDQLMGQDSWTGRLSEGNHLIEGRKEGHKPYRLEYKANSGVVETIRLEEPQPICGKLEIGGTPNAMVTLDNKSLGYSPDIFSNILIGTYQVTVSKEGYKSLSQSITIEENKTSYIDARLDMLRNVQVRITTKPALKDLSMVIDGVPYGSSFGGELNVGTRHVKLQYRGFSEEYDINVSADKNTFELPLTANLRLNTDPEGAIVYVNGEEKAQTPAVLRLPIGKYTVYMEKSGKTLLKNERTYRLDLGDNRTENIPLKEYYAYSFISYQASYTAPIGFSYGYCRNWGLYGKFQTSLPKDANRTLSADEYLAHPKTYVGCERMSITVGAMKRLSDWAYLSFGLGYGSYKYFHKFNNLVLQTSELNAPQVEFGATFQWKGCILSAGYGAIVPTDFDMNKLFTDVHLGVGFVINHH